MYEHEERRGLVGASQGINLLEGSQASLPHPEFRLNITLLKDSAPISQKTQCAYILKPKN